MLCYTHQQQRPVSIFTLAYPYEPQDIPKYTMKVSVRPLYYGQSSNFACYQ